MTTTSPAALLAADPATTLALPEFDERVFTRAELPYEVGQLLWREYGSEPQRIGVEFPSPKTGDRWLLKNLGYAGLLPLEEDLTISLQPKVPIANVFQMLEYAWRLDIFRGPEEVVGARTIREVYESLARTLARRVRDRGRKGLHRTYVERDELLTVVRGRLDLRRLARRGPEPRLHCHFEEHTPDHTDNQILLYALDRILRSGICRDEAQREVREAHRLLRGAVSPAEFAASDVGGRTYHRLNHDYRGLHALAHFFLTHTGPTHRTGRSAMMPFVINMHQLFEEFVAGWLREHLPPRLSLGTQVRGHYDSGGEVGYRIDMVLYDEAGRPLVVLDTKYKDDPVPRSEDVAQVVSYATSLGCAEAVLIYPRALEREREFQVGGVRVRTVGFALDGEVGEVGWRVVEGLVGGTGYRASHLAMAQRGRGE